MTGRRGGPEGPATERAAAEGEAVEREAADQAPDARRLTDDDVRAVLARLAEGKRVRRTVGDGFELYLERPLPFLLLYRASARGDDADMRGLVRTSAASLVAPVGASGEEAGGTGDDDASRLVGAIAADMVERFGAFLLCEIWPVDPERPARGDAADPSGKERPSGVRRPSFTVIAETLRADDPTVEQLCRALADLPLRPGPLGARIVAGEPAHPPSLPAIRVPDDVAARVHRVGIELLPVHRQGGTDIAYPDLYRVLRRGLTIAVRQTAFHFSVTHTSHAPPHFHALGRRHASGTLARADAELAAIADSFDFLLQVTPVNTDAARREFERNGGEKEPVFDYRPLVVDAGILKRRLYSVPTEEIDDPTLSHILDDTRDELDRKITMLTDRNSRRFLFGSLQVYGTVTDADLALARAVLEVPTSRARSSGDRLDAAEMAALGAREIARYRAQDPAVKATASVRADVTGLMVSRGHLLVGPTVSLTERRAEALLQHEVGTHVVTHHNGSVQPLKLLASGLAGYEELQEGLAVVAEWMVDGLDIGRLRLLAARVVAAHGVIGGATFVEGWRELVRTHGFAEGTAFGICARAHRSGGLTKDAIYLRGLDRVLQYLGAGGPVEPLLVGKVAFAHLPLVEELRWRHVLEPPRLTPHYLAGERGESRLARLRRRLTVVDLVREEA